MVVIRRLILCDAIVTMLRYDGVVELLPCCLIAQDSYTFDELPPQFVAYFFPNDILQMQFLTRFQQWEAWQKMVQT